jgi:hypothetical protein
MNDDTGFSLGVVIALLATMGHLLAGLFTP